MRPAELITIAGGKGIDLKHIAGSATNTKGIASKRPRTDEELKAGMVDYLLTAIGKDSHVAKRPQWSVAEAGQIAKSVPRMPWLAACYSWLRDRDHYRELHAALTLEAFELKEREKWPWHVMKLNGLSGFYIEELGKLVLAVEAFKGEFTQHPVLYAACMDVSDEIWSASLAQCYLALQAKYDRWLGIVSSIGSKWLREEEPEPEQAEAHG